MTVKRKRTKHFTTNYHFIKNETKYKARKIQQMIKLVEDQAEENITKVNMKDYLMLLDKLGEYNIQLKKEKVARGVAKKSLDTQVRQEGSDADGKEESASVGSGVSATDPFAI